MHAVRVTRFDPQSLVRAAAYVRSSTRGLTVQAQQHMTTKVAIVTGTARTRGIGRGCAHAFLKAGYHVMGVDIAEQQQPEQDEVLEQCSASYGFLQADLSEPSSCTRVAEETRQRFGPAIHVLINNAAVASPQPEEDPAKRTAVWLKTLATNLTGPYLLSEAVTPFMPVGEASIIHISSTRAKQAEPGGEAYSASKAGLLGLTQAQAVTLAHRVRVNAVVAGWIDTMDRDKYQISKEDRDWHLTGRVGTPQDVANMCLFLANPELSGFITGQEFVVDGGVTRKMVYPE